jgi:transposase
MNIKHDIMDIKWLLWRYIMKKVFVLAIALVAVGLTAVQAQTRQQQQELEQIAKRSMNGLSPQDRQRVVTIMTDVYVAQGMSRQQAAQIAEMSADSMFSDYQEDAQSAEARRMVEEQQRRDELGNRERQQQLQQLQQQQQQPGQNAGWPAAQLRERGIANLQQPSGTQASYNGDANWVEIIYLTGANANTMQALKRQIETIARKTMEGSGNKFSVYYRGERGNGSIIYIELAGAQINIWFFEDAA